MRRLSLSTKLFAAALPLVLAVGALLALTVRSDLNEVDDAERSAQLGVVWNPLVTALTSIEAELSQIEATPGEPADSDRLAAIAANRRTTDLAMSELGDQIAELGAAEAARKHITQSRSSLSAARRVIDIAEMAPEMAAEIDPIVAYDVALRELVSIGQLLPAESGDPELGRELLAVVKLAEARVAADAVTANIEAWQADPLDPSPLATAQVRYVQIESVMNEFTAIAPEEWAQQFRQSGFSTSLAKYRAQLDTARRAAEAQQTATFDLAGFSAMSNESLALQRDITASIVEQATTHADDTRRAALIRTAVTLGAVLVAAFVAWLLTSSVTRRVKAVSRSANQVASEQLPALVEALRDPRGKTVLPTIAPVNARGSDELAELAHAFNSMQSTLVDVAHEQVEVLRRGVSEIFVTMARRNRSLVDRQLAMLDEFEAEVDDPDVLSNYYQLDHMATRMRRNSESLLVLANAEPKRRRVKATEIDDVVRAAIGEVEDYRRIEVEALESLQVRGNVVADISHLLAELLDNATSFSPPDSVVRVGGRRAGDSYMLRIVDSGVGIGSERLRELNELLREPPIVGLSVEPTLGMSVVSLLANRHGVSVTLSNGSPGTTVDILLPSSLFGPIDVPAGIGAPGRTTVGLTEPATFGTPAMPAEQLVAWRSDTSDVAADDDFVPYEPEPATASMRVPEPAPLAAAISAPLLDPYDDVLPAADESAAVPPAAAFPAPEVERRVEPELGPNWANVAFDLTALRAEGSGGEQSADQSAGGDSSEAEPPAPLAAPAAPTSDAVPEAVPSLPTRAAVAPWSESGPAAIEDLPDAQAPVEEDAQPPVEEVAEELPAVSARSEFDRPPAPPVTADGLNRRPVTPADARPASTVKLPAGDSSQDGLPTRSPGRGPDGPDRMAPPISAGPAVTPEAPVAAPSSPSALQAALTAFDSRRPGEALPTRTRNTDSQAILSFDEPASTTQSRLDPEALRERLRAFQNEFRTASGGHDTEPTNSSPNADLGGDRR